MDRYLHTFGERMRDMSLMFEDPDLELTAKEVYSHMAFAAVFESALFVENRFMWLRIKAAKKLNANIDVFNLRKQMKVSKL